MNTLRLFSHFLSDNDHLGRAVSITQYPSPLRTT